MALALDLNHLAENHPRGYERLFGKPFPAEVLAYRPMPDNLRGELALSMPDLAESNECPRQRQPQADSPVACTNCKNLCRRRALIALRAPVTVAGGWSRSAAAAGPCHPSGSPENCRVDFGRAP